MHKLLQAEKVIFWRHEAILAAEVPQIGQEYGEHIEAVFISDPGVRARDVSDVSMVVIFFIRRMCHINK